MLLELFKKICVTLKCFRPVLMLYYVQSTECSFSKMISFIEDHLPLCEEVITKPNNCSHHPWQRVLQSSITANEFWPTPLFRLVFGAGTAYLKHLSQCVWLSDTLKFDD